MNVVMPHKYVFNLVYSKDIFFGYCLSFYLIIIVLLLQINQLPAQWQQTTAPRDPSGVYALTFQGNNLFAGISSLGIYRSTDQGISWTEKNNGLFNYSIRDFAIIGTNIFVATVGAGIFRSSDSETSWISVSSGLGDLEVVALSAKGTKLFAGTSGNGNAGVYLSNDSGNSWVKASNGLTTPASVKALASSGLYVFAGVYGVGDSAGVFVSSDDGGTWTPANTGLANRYVWKLTFKGNYLFAGMDNGGGIYLSTDYGANWNAVNSGMTDSIIQSFAVSGTNIFVGTYTGGVFLSTNNGSEWTAIDSGLTNKDIKSLAVDSMYVYAGTAGAGVGANGVWHRPLSEVIPLTLADNVKNNWNMISMPLTVADYTKTALFPTATSNAFTYNGGYVLSDTLKNGSGYWLKFSGEQTVNLTGLQLSLLTVNVQPGWNMIGSISQPIAAASITSHPSAIVTSQFFGFQGHYAATDSIQPGKGYWVRASEAGMLILTSGPLPPLANRIIITPTSELPPVPPDVITSNQEPVPTTFALEQNYPNPFNPVTIIRYALPAEGQVRLSVYNMLGQEMKVLVNEVQSAGYKSVSFDASNLPSGIYSYRLTASTYVNVKKMLLVK